MDEGYVTCMNPCGAGYPRVSEKATKGQTTQDKITARKRKT